MFKINIQDTSRRSGVVLVSLLLKYPIPFSSVSIVDFEQVNTGWVI